MRKTFAVIVLLGSVLWAVITPTASAASIRGWGNAVTDRCLDDSLAYGLRTAACNSTNFQRWESVPSPDGTTGALRNVETGRCVDFSPNGLQALGCNGTVYQKIAYVTFTGALRTQFQGQCLDDSLEFGLRVLGCNSTDFQAWATVA